MAPTLLIRGIPGSFTYVCCDTNQRAEGQKFPQPVQIFDVSKISELNPSVIMETKTGKRTPFQAIFSQPDFLFSLRRDFIKNSEIFKFFLREVGKRSQLITSQIA
jgi:hypothetical protein